MNMFGIARVAHEVNRAYCGALGDFSQKAWVDAPEWQRENFIRGVIFQQEHSNADAEETHDAWVQEKLAQGWMWGPIKDIRKQEHPCLMAYDDLPLEDRVKNFLFRGVVDVLLAMEDEAKNQQGS